MAPLVRTRDSDAGGAWLQVTRERPDVPGLLRRTGWSEESSGPRTRREAGAPSALLMLQVATPLEVADGAGRRRVGSFVAAPSDRWTDTAAVGRGEGVHVDLHPLLARRLLGRPLGELRAATWDAEDLGLPWVLALTDRLGATAGWAERLDLVDDAVRRRLSDTPASVPPELARAHALLHRGLGVQEVADDVGWGRRRLHRRMLGEVGLTPSQVRRLGRFARARRLLERTDLPLAEVAARTGWTDQSHLHREVRGIAGRTPGQLRGVPSVQDDEPSGVPVSTP